MASKKEESPVGKLYQESYRTIAECLVHSEVGFLIGAGMSRDSGVNTGPELARRMLRRATLGAGQEGTEHPVLDRLAISFPFEAISQHLTQKLGTHQIARWLAEEGGFAGPKPNDGHSRLYELWAFLGRKSPRMIFTTNFDHLIEDRFGKDAVCITSSNVADLAKAKAGHTLGVVHLHGCVKYPDSIVFGEEEQATLEGPVFDLFRASLATEVFVIVGYSLSDTNMRGIFFDVQRIARTRRGLAKRTFAVSPAAGSIADPESESVVVRAIWANRGIEHIAVSANQFFTDLYEFADQFALRRMRADVAKALDKDEDTLNAMLESATEPFDVMEPQDFLEYLYHAIGSRKPEGEKEEK